MSFDFDLSLYTVVIVSVAVIATVWLCVMSRNRMGLIVRHRRASDSDVAIRDNVTLPPMSVVVYVRDNSAQLEAMLPSLLAQNYPADFEVIVTIDGKSEQAIDVVKRASVEHRNLRITFVPDQAHALSRKKLALTLGVKGARYDCVLLTDAAVTISSYGWLAAIGAQFASGSDVVLGQVVPFDADARRVSGMVLFDVLNERVNWTASAIKGRPYRATSANIAFRKSVFEAKQGFAGSVGYHHGEDDIFVSRICRNTAYAVLLSPQSQLGLECVDLRVWHKNSKLSHLFTGKYVDKRARRVAGTCSLAMWLWLASAVTAGVYCAPNMLPLSVVLGLGLVWLTVNTLGWVAAGRALRMPVKAWTLPLLMFVRPFYNLIYKFKSYADKSHNYTWAKPN